MTSEDLGYKPGIVEKTKFEYSPLAIVFENLNMLKLRIKSNQKRLMIKEKQLDAIENQLKAEKNDGKTKLIVYLKDEIKKNVSITS